MPPWHLCAETSLYFIDAETDTLFLVTLCLSLLSVPLWDLGYGKDNFQVSLLLTLIPAEYWDSFCLVHQRCFRGERSLPLMDKQDGAVWGRGCGWRTLRAACHLAEAKQSCSRQRPCLRKGGSWELIAMTHSHPDHWFLESCYHLLFHFQSSCSQARPTNDWVNSWALWIWQTFLRD